MLSRLKTQKGFTLIELMIVVAIIGILAAIAIPNFIAYRNKSFCSAAEKDADGIAAAIADYFSIPSRINTPVLGDLNDGRGYTMSREGKTGANSAQIDGVDPTVNITITVTDGSTRCPDAYKAANQASVTGGGRYVDGWAGAGSNLYYKYMTP